MLSNNLVVWAKNSNHEHENEWNIISKWWQGLEGKRIKWQSMQGTSSDPSTEVVKEVLSLEELVPFTINAPNMIDPDYILEFKEGERFHRYPKVQRLELNINMNQLKIFHSESNPHFYYIFTVIPEYKQSSASFKVT